MIGKTRIEVRATLNENGEVSAKVFGRCSYGEGEDVRDATEFVEVTDGAVLAKLGKALTAAIADVSASVARTAGRSASKCYVVAAERGEYDKKEVKKDAK